jgi:hypothetical protein
MGLERPPAGYQYRVLYRKFFYDIVVLNFDIEEWPGPHRSAAHRREHPAPAVYGGILRPGPGPGPGSLSRKPSGLLTPCRIDNTLPRRLAKPDRLRQLQVSGRAVFAAEMRRKHALAQRQWAPALERLRRARSGGANERARTARVFTRALCSELCSVKFAVKSAVKLG